MGVNAPACLEQLGQALNTLSGAACCRWGCSNGDHLVEYLLGRAASNGHAAYRLFGQDSSALVDWRGATRRERLGKFSPAKVRERLEGMNFRIGIDRDRYAALCEIGVHATPETKPNLHSPDRRL